MIIKSILCIFGGSKEELDSLNTALILGKTYGAQVCVLHVSSNPSAYAGIYGEGIIVSAPIIEAIEKENKERLAKAKQYMVSFTAKHHIPLDAPDSPAHHTSARFIHLTGMVDSTIGREGRLNDLIVIGREGTPAHDLITPALFNTGRPVLIMPTAHEGIFRDWRDKTVALAWDGSLQAARALYNALPLIEKAEALHILVSREHRKVFDLEAEQGIMAYLRAHGFKPNVIVTDREQHAIGEALLGKAEEMKADLLVMGAYGHSMFREIVLGGVTEYILQKADIPLLLSH